MAESDQSILQDIATLEQLIDAGVITLDSFGANPERVPPCGGRGTTLSWVIGVHPSLAPAALQNSFQAVQFELDQGVIPIDGIGASLPRIGAKVVQPITTSDFVLLARLRQVKVPLGSVRVTVDASRCRPICIPEEVLKGTIELLLSRKFGANSDFKLGRVTLQITTGDVALSISFTYGTPIGDVQIQLNAHFLLLVQDCRARVIDSNVSIDLLPPAFLELLFPVVLNIVEAFVGAELLGTLRPELIQQFQSLINQFIPQNLCLCHLEAVPHEINALACPPQRPIPTA